MQNKPNGFVPQLAHNEILSVSAAIHQSKPPLHIRMPRSWTCLPNTPHNRNGSLWKQHEITLVPVIAVSALRVIKGLPRLVIWCLCIYYSTLEGKLTRKPWITLPLLFVMLHCCCCVGDRWVSSSSSGQIKNLTCWRLLHWRSDQ